MQQAALYRRERQFGEVKTVLWFVCDYQRDLRETLGFFVQLIEYICVNQRENYPNHVYIPLALLAIYTPERIRALPRYAIVVIGSFRNNALTMTVVIGLR